MSTRNFLRYLPLLSLLAAPLPAVSQPGAPLPPIQGRPLYSSASAPSAMPIAPPASADPRATDIAERLKATLSVAREANPAVVPGPHGKATSPIRIQQQTAGKARIRMRHNTGTPRYIEADELEPAAALRSSANGGDDIGTARNFLRKNKELLRLRDPDGELVLEKDERDSAGLRHLRFEQRYHGIRVWPANLGVHLDAAGRVDLMTGAYVPTPEVAATKPVVAARDAVARGRLNVPSGDRGEASAAELIIYAPGEQTPRLAWKFELLVSMIEHWLVVIDAGDGRILTQFNQVYEAAAQGSGTDLFGQTKPLNLWEENGTYFLCDTSKKMFDPTSQPPNPQSTRGGIIVLDARNQPADNNPQSNPDLFHFTSPTPNGFDVPGAVSASFTVSRVYDFYLSQFNRNSFDDKGSTIPVMARYGSNLKNAFFAAPIMILGDGEKFAGAIDVVAHEVSHGVTQTTSNLMYQNQSGAINESFSDILGEMCEFHTTGSNDWLLGTTLSKISRNMKDPGSIDTGLGGPFPSKMSEFFNLDINTDKGGVHINSSIINHCYYFVAEGLGGGIGRVDAEKIFYRANTVYLMQNSQFVDMRLACIRAARDLFGQNSAQEQKVAAAFDAVEIFDAGGTPDPPDIPSVNGEDSTLFIYGDPTNGFFLARREAALNDPNEGRFLGQNFASLRSPSVSGSGALGVYVTADNDIALFRTDGQGEQKLGFPGLVNSVAISPDGTKFGFVFRGSNGQPDNQISVIDVATPNAEPQTFVLKKPVIDGGLSGSIAFADAMVFTADSRFIIYDAQNQLQLANGSQIQVFSIYSIELANGVIHEVIPAQPGYDIGNPSLSHTSDNFLVFEAVDQNTHASVVITENLNAGTLKVVGQSGAIAAPKYTGADDGVVYTEVNPQTHTGVSIVRQALAADRQTATGDRTLWIPDGGFGFIYRRGEFHGPPPTVPSRLANIATRGRVGTGDNVMIGGFIVQGNAPKTVVVRAIGPSLTAAGVQGALADPQLELYNNSGTLLKSNDDWKTAQAEIQPTGLAPTNDAESALVQTLQPGPYTAILRGKNNAAGVALVEVYDIAPTADSKLANIATRANVGTGDNVMIGGFIVQGPDPRRVIVRAIGPSLPVAGKLTDPTLQLFSGTNSVGQNDNWRSSQEQEIIATQLAPTNNNEAAVVATLLPGAYTAIVQGTGGNTGIALVEVYDLP